MHQGSVAGSQLSRLNRATSGCSGKCVITKFFSIVAVSASTITVKFLLLISCSNLSCRELGAAWIVLKTSPNPCKPRRTDATDSRAAPDPVRLGALVAVGLGTELVLDVGVFAMF